MRRGNSHDGRYVGEYDGSGLGPGVGTYDGGVLGSALGDDELGA